MGNHDKFDLNFPVYPDGTDSVWSTGGAALQFPNGTGSFGPGIYSPAWGTMVEMANATGYCPYENCYRNEGTSAQHGLHQTFGVAFFIIAGIGSSAVFLYSFGLHCWVAREQRQCGQTAVRVCPAPTSHAKQIAQANLLPGICNEVYEELRSGAEGSKQMEEFGVKTASDLTYLTEEECHALTPLMSLKAVPGRKWEEWIRNHPKPV